MELKNNNSFVELSNNELMSVEGGMAFVVAAAICAPVAVASYKVGKVIGGWIFK